MTTDSLPNVSEVSPERKTLLEYGSFKTCPKLCRFDGDTFFPLSLPRESERNIQEHAIV